MQRRNGAFDNKREKMQQEERELFDANAKQRGNALNVSYCDFRGLTALPKVTLWGPNLGNNFEL